MDFDAFVGRGSLVSETVGSVEDGDGREYAEAAREAALEIGRVVMADAVPGVDVWAYEGDAMESVVALRNDAPGSPAVGCYEGLSLWVEPEMRGRGLGERLVVEAAKARGGSPVAGEEAVAFSEAGWEVHGRAYETCREENVFEAPPEP